MQFTRKLFLPPAIGVAICGFSYTVNNLSWAPSFSSAGSIISFGANCSDHPNSKANIILWPKDGRIRIKIYSGGAIHYTLDQVYEDYELAVEVARSTILKNTG